MSKVTQARVILPMNDILQPHPTIHFVFESLVAANFSGIASVSAKIQSFFNSTATGATNKVGAYLGESVTSAPPTTTIEYYDITGHLDGSPAGSPAAITTFGLSATPLGGGAIPDGVAAAFGLQADYGTDVEFGASGTRPRARDRNRFYLGPINASALDTNPSGTSILATLFVTDVLHALHDLSITADVGGEAWNLRVWSRKNASTKLPIIAYADTRVDYQRRRSHAAGAVRHTQALAAV